MLISVDGYFEGENHDLSWHNVDEEFQKFAIAQLKEIDFILFGKTTYEMMARFWRSTHAKKIDPVTAELMTNTDKIVFSKTLRSADWEHTQIRREVDPKEIIKLKKQSGKYISIFGSSDLALSFIKHNLIDEFRILVNPLVLGRGTSLFHGIQKYLQLELVDIRTFGNGNVLLTYTAQRTYQR